MSEPGESGPVSIDEVADLLDHLDDAAWVEMGMWLPDGVPDTHFVRKCAPGPDVEAYLGETAPQDTPALRLQRSLAEFLGR